MKITLICAMGENNEIGSKNALLWDLPRDMRHFREKTAQKTVIMGRKTYESIGKLLPNRRNIILSRNTDFTISTQENYQIFSDIPLLMEALQSENIPEVFVIGGALVYEQFLPFATHFSLTFVHQSFPNADSFFPDISAFLRSDSCIKLSEKKFFADKNHKYDFDIFEFEKKL